MDIFKLVDAGYKIVTGLATLGILWAVWKIALWVQLVDSRLDGAETFSKTQWALLQSLRSDISKLFGFMLGRTRKEKGPDKLL